MFATLFVLSASLSGQEDQLVRHQYEGTLGNGLIGMTILRRGNDLKGGHYFYQKYLKDISLTGAVQGSNITLNEPNGAFHLHFIGNGSEHGEPLNFENSVGMNGTWTTADSRRSYPVSLSGAYEVDYSGRRYAQVTDDSDAAFEKRVQACFHATLAGDKNTVLRLIGYPLSVNLPNGRRKIFKNSNQVLAAWNSVFTSALIAKLSRDLPHDMFVHNGEAMLGDGEAWFDAKGLAVLNIPDPSQKFIAPKLP